MKTNAWAVWGSPEAWGPWARAQRAHWIRRPCKPHCAKNNNQIKRGVQLLYRFVRNSQATLIMNSCTLIRIQHAHCVPWSRWPFF